MVDIYNNIASIAIPLLFIFYIFSPFLHIYILSCLLKHTFGANRFMFISHITDCISVFTAKSHINESKLILKRY